MASPGTAAPSHPPSRWRGLRSRCRAWTASAGSPVETMWKTSQRTFRLPGPLSPSPWLWKREPQHSAGHARPREACMPPSMAAAGSRSPARQGSVADGQGRRNAFDPGLFLIGTLVSSHRAPAKSPEFVAGSQACGILAAFFSRGRPAPLALISRGRLSSARTSPRNATGVVSTASSGGWIRRAAGVSFRTGAERAAPGLRPSKGGRPGAGS